MSLFVIQTPDTEATFDVICSVLDYAGEPYIVGLTDVEELAKNLAKATAQLEIMQTNLNKGMSKSIQKLMARSIGEVLDELNK